MSSPQCLTELLQVPGNLGEQTDTRFFKHKDFICKVAFFKNKYVIWLSVQFSGRRLSVQPVPSPEKYFN